MPVKPSTGAGLVMVPLGSLIAWGGLTGYLPAILAALFAPSELERRQTSSLDLPPPILIPGQGGSPIPQIGPGDNNAPLQPGSFGSPQLEEPIYNGEVVPPNALPGGENGVIPYYEGYTNIPVEQLPASGGTGGAPASGGDSILNEAENALKDIGDGLKDIVP